MKKITTVLLPTVLLATCAMAADNVANKSKEYVGEISDSQCAFAVHSKSGTHEQVRKVMGGTDELCVKSCAGMGGKYVLITSRDHKVFRLDQQELAAKFPARKVKVTGSLIEHGKTIKVDKIVASK